MTKVTPHAYVLKAHVVIKSMEHSLMYPDCNPKCIEKQLDAYHNQDKPDGPGCDDKTPLRTDPDAATRSAGTLSVEAREAVKKAVLKVSGIPRSGRAA